MVVDPNEPPIVPTDHAPTEGHTPPSAASERVVYLDPRITSEAVMALLCNADQHDRFMLRVDPTDRGLVHQWTDVDGVEYQQTVDVEIFEVTRMVWDRVRRIREAVTPAPLVSSGMVDAASATSWGDLPGGHWQNQALAATHAPAPEADDRIVVASREPDSDEWIYVRVTPATAAELRDKLSSVLDEVSESGASLAAQEDPR